MRLYVFRFFDLTGSPVHVHSVRLATDLAARSLAEDMLGRHAEAQSLEIYSLGRNVAVLRKPKARMSGVG